VSDVSVSGGPARTDDAPTEGMTGSPLAATPALDVAMIDSLRTFGREPGLLLEFMLRAYLVEAAQLLVEIARAARDGDAVLGRALHRLRGASSFVGASRVTAACQVLERCAQHDRRARHEALAAIRGAVNEALGATQLLLLEGSP
jgi:HPt (histidine-containing phosphotransfer) domain-containing protein